MSARDVNEKAGAAAFAAFLNEYRIRAQNPRARPASTRDWLEEACGRYRETFLAALAAAGYVVVPREPSERMCSAGIDIIGREFGESDWETARQMAEGLWPQPIYAAMLVAAEAEAKETPAC